MTEWINIKEVTPEEGDDVLAFIRRQDSEEWSIFNCVYYGMTSENPTGLRLVSSGCGCCDKEIEEASHWMPMPKPPNCS